MPCGQPTPNQLKIRLGVATGWGAMDPYHGINQHYGLPTMLTGVDGESETTGRPDGQQVNGSLAVIEVDYEIFSTRIKQMP
jgi:hypothetical protein